MEVERAPSESSDGFSALGSQYSGGHDGSSVMSDETDMTVATEAIADELSESAQPRVHKLAKFSIFCILL